MVSKQLGHDWVIDIGDCCSLLDQHEGARRSTQEFFAGNLNFYIFMKDSTSKTKTRTRTRTTTATKRSVISIEINFSSIAET